MSAGVLALDSTGRQAAIPLRRVTGPLATLVRCRIALDTVLGSWAPDGELGLPVARWLAETPPPVVVEGAVRQQLQRVSTVRRVEEVSAEITDARWMISVVVVVDGDAGGAPVAARITRDDAYLAGPWYLLLGRRA